MKSWDAAQYTRFEAERNRPIHDLLAQLPREGVRTAVDIGCGPGNSTELVIARYPQAAVSGMDSSPEMVEAARKRLPGVPFAVADVSGWRSPTGPVDLLFKVAPPPSSSGSRAAPCGPTCSAWTGRSSRRSVRATSRPSPAPVRSSMTAPCCCRSRACSSSRVAADAKLS